MPDGGLRFPFSSSRKRMSTMVNTAKGSCLLIKGASEYILGACEKIQYWDDNTIKDMTPELVKEIKNNITIFARKTLRTLVLAFKYLPSQTDNIEEADEHGVYEIEKSGFTLLCITGIRDILRPTVKHSVK